MADFWKILQESGKARGGLALALFMLYGYTYMVRTANPTLTDHIAAFGCLFFFFAGGCIALRELFHNKHDDG